MKTWGVILATVVIFAAGVVTGGLLVNTLVQRKVAPIPIPPRPPPQQLFLGRFENERRGLRQLPDLTPEQRRNTERVIRETQERIADLMSFLEPDMQEVFQKMRAKITQELTPEQRLRLDENLKRMADMGPNFPPSGPPKAKRFPPSGP